jgi:hypothetical protein
MRTEKLILIVAVAGCAAGLLLPSPVFPWSRPRPGRRRLESTWNSRGSLVRSIRASPRRRRSGAMPRQQRSPSADRPP